MKKHFNLRLFFDGEGTAPGGAEGEANNANYDGVADQEPEVIYGKREDPREEPQNDDTNEEGMPSYEQFKQRYKDEYQKDVQRLIDKRFKAAKKTKTEYNALKSKIGALTDVLGARYGTNDYDELLEAINADESLIEAGALEKGMSTEEYRATLKADRLQKQLDAQSEQAEQEALVAKWQQEAEELKALYPDFNLEEEIENEEFAADLQSGKSMRKAYQNAHFDDILSGVIRYTAESTKSAISKAKQTRQSRPSENGARSAAAAIVKSDVNKLTKDDIKEINKRVLRGERISF